VRIIVFAKAPQPGRVKTRLQPALTGRQAADLYEASLRDVVGMLEVLGRDLRIAYDPASGGEEYFATTFPRLRRDPQSEGDLGDRMGAAFEDAFRDGDSGALIVGGDSPTLPAAYVQAAIAALPATDVVLGPTADGGYYLVGIGRGAWPKARSLFTSIPWSTDQVLARTLARARLANLSSHLLPAWYDIDEPDDIARAEQDVRPESHFAEWLRSWRAGPAAGDRR
jgi:uncharacterized protein